MLPVFLTIFRKDCQKHQGCYFKYEVRSQETALIAQKTCQSRCSFRKIQLPQKISLFERTNVALTDGQERMKNEKDKLSREALFLIEEKGRFEGGIDEIKKTIANIQKTVAESVQD